MVLRRMKEERDKAHQYGHKRGIREVSLVMDINKGDQYRLPNKYGLEEEKVW